MASCTVSAYVQNVSNVRRRADEEKESEGTVPEKYPHIHDDAAGNHLPHMQQLYAHVRHDDRIQEGELAEGAVEKRLVWLR